MCAGAVGVTCVCARRCCVCVCVCVCAGAVCVNCLCVCVQVLCVEKEAPSDQPSSVQMKKPNVAAGNPGAATPVSDPLDPAFNPALSAGPSSYSLGEGLEGPHPGSPMRLRGSGLSTSNLALSGSQHHLGHKESTPSIASDISNPLATQELQQRLHQLQKYDRRTLTPPLTLPLPNPAPRLTLI